MNPEKIKQYREAFEAVAHEKGGIEYWFARDLQVLFDYTQWRNFLLVIEKAMEACKNSQQEPVNHFAGVSKMVEIGSGAECEVELPRRKIFKSSSAGSLRRRRICAKKSKDGIGKRSRRNRDRDSMDWPQNLTNKSPAYCHDEKHKMPPRLVRDGRLMLLRNKMCDHESPMHNFWYLGLCFHPFT